MCWCYECACTSVFVLRMCLWVSDERVSGMNVLVGELCVCVCLCVCVSLSLCVCGSLSQLLSHLHLPSFCCFACAMVHPLSACFPIVLVSLMSCVSHHLCLSYLRCVLCECCMPFVSFVSPSVLPPPPPQHQAAIQQQKTN